MRQEPHSGRRSLVLPLALAAAMGATACHKLEYVSLHPLEEAGFHYNAVHQLEGLDLTKPEVDELVKALQGGVDDETCVQLIRVVRGQKTRFAEGDAAASLHAAGIADATILELAQLRQLGPWHGEAGAIRLTGTSDRVILAVAKRRAAGQPAPSGASLAKMKDAGASEATIIELVQNGINDDDAASIEFRKKKGWKDEQILRDYPPKQ